MIIVELWIKSPISDRKKHIDLSEPCIERGGKNTWREARGVLAHFLDTNIPVSLKGKKICCCHACHNSKCSNPKHLYWGTAFENNYGDNGKITTTFGQRKTGMHVIKDRKHKSNALAS